MADASMLRDAAALAPSGVAVVAPTAASHPLHPHADEPMLPARFTADAMARRHDAHYRQTVRRRYQRSRHDIVLVTNNFVTGGAQSSARRLLVEWQRRGLDVAAATIQEHPEQTSAGFKALSIDKVALPPAGAFTPEQTVEALLDWLRTDRVLMWNVIPEHKVLFAELWRGPTLIDVSPGEMFFASLQRYFVKPRPDHPVRTARAYGSLLDGVIVKFAAEAERARRELGVDAHVVSNGVVLPPQLHRPRQGPFTIATLARLSPDKKLEQLLTAFSVLKRRLPDARLLVGGDAETGSEAYADALKAAHPQVDWLGHVAPDERFFSRVHAFALIAEPEGCPNASLEARAHGVPVVGTDAGGAREQILDGETGYLVPRGDSLALAERLVQLAAEPESQQSFSRAARARCESLFSVDAMATAYTQILGSVSPFQQFGRTATRGN